MIRSFRNSDTERVWNRGHVGEARWQPRRPALDPRQRSVPYLRLSKVLGVDDRFWINIQTDYDLEVERDRHGSEPDEITPLVAS